VATDPVYSGQTQGLVVANVAAANTARDGTGTIVTLLTPPAAGYLVRGVQLEATVTTAAGIIILWHTTNSGTTWRKIGEVIVSAVTPSTTSPAWTYLWTPPRGPRVIPGVSGNLLGITSTIAQSINAIVDGGDLT
jgi:hypothetical protein